MKLLVDLLVAWALWWFIRRMARPQRPFQSAPRPPPARQQVRAVGEMVACTHCGLYIPRSEGIPGAEGAVFCCPEHKEAAARR